MSLSLDPSAIATLARCIDRIGTERFPKHFATLCQNIAQADSAHLSAFFAEGRPAEIYASRTDPETIDALALYLDVAFVLDPFYQLFLTTHEDRVDSLGDIAPDDFRRSEYYAKFFRALSLSDECGVTLPMGSGAALFLSLGTQGARRIRTAHLREALPLVAALARRHWTVLTPDRFDGTGRLAAQLDAAFVEFGNSVLSPREGQIARMILQGHSSKAIANTFGNSPETIKVHRKRIYTKLSVTGQGELLSLFLKALRHMPAGAQGDPLIFIKA